MRQSDKEWAHVAEAQRFMAFSSRFELDRVVLGCNESDRHGCQGYVTRNVTNSQPKKFKLPPGRVGYF
jgi:hypothetical protein